MEAVGSLTESRAKLPARYDDDWLAPFFEMLAPALVADAQILDVGCGRWPTLAPERRPAGCRYVGLDSSAAELAAAPPGAYDETVVVDVTQPVSRLESSFDAIVSWQALEHVKPLDAAVENMRSWLRPGGLMVSQLSGGLAAFALLGRALPHRLRTQAMQRLLGHPAEAKFPTRYHRCTYSALDRMLSGWSEHEVVPRWRGGVYFLFSQRLLAAYVAYEEWAVAAGHVNLATHYLVSARR